MVSLETDSGLVRGLQLALEHFSLLLRLVHLDAHLGELLAGGRHLSIGLNEVGLSILESNGKLFVLRLHLIKCSLEHCLLLLQLLKLDGHCVLELDKLGLHRSTILLVLVLGFGHDLKLLLQVVDFGLRVKAALHGVVLDVLELGLKDAALLLLVRKLALNVSRLGLRLKSPRAKNLDLVVDKAVPRALSLKVLVQLQELRFALILDLGAERLAVCREAFHFFVGDLELLLEVVLFCISVHELDLELGHLGLLLLVAARCRTACWWGSGCGRAQLVNLRKGSFELRDEFRHALVFRGLRPGIADRDRVGGCAGARGDLLGIGLTLPFTHLWPFAQGVERIEHWASRRHEAARSLCLLLCKLALERRNLKRFGIVLSREQVDLVHERRHRGGRTREQAVEAVLGIGIDLIIFIFQLQSRIVVILTHQLAGAELVAELGRTGAGCWDGRSTAARLDWRLRARHANERAGHFFGLGEDLGSVLLEESPFCEHGVPHRSRHAFLPHTVEPCHAHCLGDCRIVERDEHLLLARLQHANVERVAFDAGGEALHGHGFLLDAATAVSARGPAELVVWAAAKAGRLEVADEALGRVDALEARAVRSGGDAVGLGRQRQFDRAARALGLRGGAGGREGRRERVDAVPA
mmetsp:Transcript_19858/g.56764  ORF Transcript_19858/g.56764 Transcript_19858/m.56764 type:complete len:639 (+) Transcript_19858:647-2563(+)